MKGIHSKFPPKSPISAEDIWQHPNSLRAFLLNTATESTEKIIGSQLELGGINPHARGLVAPGWGHIPL